MTHTTLQPAAAVQATVQQPAPVQALLQPPQPVQVLLAQPSHVQAVLRPPEAVVATLAVGQGPAGVGAMLRRVAAVDINAHKAVVTDALGMLTYASAANASHMARVVGVAVTSALAGADVQVLSAGELVNAGWSWTPGAALYLGLNGDLTHDPGQGVFLQCLGHAMTATSIFIRPSRAILRA